MRKPISAMMKRSVPLVLCAALSIPVMTGDVVRTDTSPDTVTVAASGTIVYVQESVSGNKDRALRASVSFVDKFTSSRMVFGKCRPKVRCIRVVNSWNTHDHAGWFSCKSYYDCTIRIHPLARNTFYYMRALMDHELAHAFYVGHNPRCTSRAYAPIWCGKKLAPRTFTASERAILRRH